MTYETIFITKTARLSQVFKSTFHTHLSFITISWLYPILFISGYSLILIAIINISIFNVSSFIFFIVLYGTCCIRLLFFNILKCASRNFSYWILLSNLGIWFLYKINLIVTFILTQLLMFLKRIIFNYLKTSILIKKAFQFHIRQYIFNQR